MLKRYWLVANPENRFGPKNLGVTAFSVLQAKSLIIEELRRLGWQQIPDEQINEAEIIENIDIQELDQLHVIPNIGIVTRQGVWFPNCNS